MILLRHGQSEFNLHFGATRRRSGHGGRQADRAWACSGRGSRRSVCAGEGIRRIIVSPYTRALQTAAPIAAALGVPVFVNPIVRERYKFACDIGTPRTELERAWPQHDFSTIDEIWWPPIEEPEEFILGRARLFRAEMAALPDWSDTLVVSPLGVHSVADRAERDERAVAALRSDHAGTRGDHLAGLSRHRPPNWRVGAWAWFVLPGARWLRWLRRSLKRSIRCQRPRPPRVPAAAPRPPPLVVNIQYVKDLSFEVPGAPQIYSQLRGAAAGQHQSRRAGAAGAGRPERLRGRARDPRRGARAVSGQRRRPPRCRQPCSSPN